MLFWTLLYPVKCIPKSADFSSFHLELWVFSPHTFGCVYLPPSNGPYRLRSARSHVRKSFGGIPCVRENLLFWTWTLTWPRGRDCFLLPPGAGGVWTRCARKCWPSSNCDVTRTCHRISDSRESKAKTISASFRTRARVWDSFSRVKPASHPVNDKRHRQIYTFTRGQGELRFSRLFILWEIAYC